MVVNVRAVCYNSNIIDIFRAANCADGLHRLADFEGGGNGGAVMFWDICEDS